MMRTYALLAALLLSKAAAHPLCYIDAKPTDYDEILTFCPEAQAGACCTDLEEAEVEARYDAVSTVALTGDCADLYKEVRARCARRVPCVPFFVVCSFFSAEQTIWSSFSSRVCGGVYPAVIGV